MGTLQQVESARKLARYAIVIGYVMALGALILALVNDSPRVPANLWGVARAVAVAGLFSISPTVALLALRGRPRLLPAAAAVALVAGPFTLSVLGLVMVVPAVLWISAFSRWPRPVRTVWRETVLWSTIVIVAACAFVSLFLHQDPRCTRFYSDGTAETSVATGGGWLWQGTSGTVVSSVLSGGEVRSEECTSDIVVWWEALASLGFAAGSVVIAARGGAPTRASSGAYAVPDGHR